MSLSGFVKHKIIIKYSTLSGIHTHNQLTPLGQLRNNERAFIQAAKHFVTVSVFGYAALFAYTFMTIIYIMNLNNIGKSIDFLFFRDVYKGAEHRQAVLLSSFCFVERNFGGIVALTNSQPRMNVPFLAFEMWIVPSRSSLSLGSGYCFWNLRPVHILFISYPMILIRHYRHISTVNSFPVSIVSLSCIVIAPSFLHPLYNAIVSNIS